MSIFSYVNTAFCLTTETIANAIEGNVSNPGKANDNSGTLAIPTPPSPIIEDRTGSQFSNKVVDIANMAQIKALKVFGANLFNSQCSTLPKIALYNPNYLISIGDKISITIWGAFEYGENVTVDSQGNIFLPKVGPVKVRGIKNKDLNSTVNKALKKTFESNVTAYANLLTAQPIEVFVSGYVAKPGLYGGMSSDSILYFLCKSGGIRHIKHAIDQFLHNHLVS